MDLTRCPIAPAERVAAAFNIALALAWLTATPRGGPVPWPVAVHVALATLPWLLGSAGGSRRLGGTLRDLYPMVSFAVFWSELGALHAGGGRSWDAAIASLDARLFGTHLSAVWMPAMPQVWFSELMHLAYVGYYAMVIVPPLAFAVTGDRAALREFVLRLTATYAVCFTAYLLFPVLGPARTLPLYSGALTSGFFYQLSHAAHAVGDAAGTAFPSSHVAGAMAVAWTCRGHCPRWAGWALALLAAAVAASTIYTQNHYPVDVVGGVIVALAVQLALVPSLERVGSRAPARPRVRAPAPLPDTPVSIP